jgi:hypothetical protein
LVFSLPEPPEVDVAGAALVSVFEFSEAGDVVVVDAGAGEELVSDLELSAAGEAVVVVAGVESLPVAGVVAGAVVVAFVAGGGGGVESVEEAESLRPQPAIRRGSAKTDAKTESETEEVVFIRC